MKKKTLAGSFTSAAAAFSAASCCMMNAFAEESASSGTSGNAQSPSMMPMILSLVLMLVLLYFMAIKPQKKREQEMKNMQESLQVGDEIITSGGIVGIIVRKGDDTSSASRPGLSLRTFPLLTVQRKPLARRSLTQLQLLS